MSGPRPWVRVELGQSASTRVPVAGLVAHAAQLASVVGVPDQQRAYVQRLDLAADFTGWPLVLSDVENFVRPSASRASVHFRGTSMASRIDFRRDLTGIVLCPGGDLQLRIYDKLRELREHPNNSAHIQQVWRRGGWQSGVSVTRVEFQLRRDVLRELGVESTHGLHNRIDPVWQYGVNTFRLVQAGTTRLRRGKPDPRWAAARSVVFVAPAKPARRVR